MPSPEQAVSALAARHPQWAVLFGRFSREFVAFPLWAGYAHRGMVTARHPDRLEQAMARVEAASGHHQPSGTLHVNARADAARSREVHVRHAGTA